MYIQFFLEMMRSFHKCIGVSESVKYFKLFYVSELPIPLTLLLGRSFKPQNPMQEPVIEESQLSALQSQLYTNMYMYIYCRIHFNILMYIDCVPRFYSCVSMSRYSKNSLGAVQTSTEQTVLLLSVSDRRESLEHVQTFLMGLFFLHSMHFAKLDFLNGSYYNQQI